MEPTEGPTVRKTKRLAAVVLALGGALAGSIGSASATGGGVQLAACTSANYNAHVVWFKFTKTDGTTFCVGGGTGTVGGLSVDIKAFDSFGVDTAEPTTRYYGYLDVSVGGFPEKLTIGDWPTVPGDATDWFTLSLPCPVTPPGGWPIPCPIYGSSAHVTAVEVVGVNTD